MAAWALTMLTLELAIVDVEAWLLLTAQVVLTSTTTLSLERIGVDDHGLVAVPLELLEVQAGPPWAVLGRCISRCRMIMEIMVAKRGEHHMNSTYQSCSTQKMKLWAPN